MTSARSQLVSELRTALPDMYVKGAADLPDRVTRPTVLVWQNNVTRFEQLGLDRIRVELAVWLLTGRESMESAEDQLEASLDALLTALQPITWTDWSVCERLTAGEEGGPNYHGYKLTLTALGQIGTD